LVQLPRHQIRLSKPHHPRSRPFVEAARNEIALRFREPRSQKFNSTHRSRVSRGPRSQRNQQTHGHPRNRENQFPPIGAAVPPHYENNPYSDQQKRRLGTHQRSYSDDYSAEQEPSHGGQQGFPVKRLERALHARMAEKERKYQERQRRQECGQHFREHHGAVTRREWTKRRQPQRNRRDKFPFLRGREARRNQGGQNAGRQINDSL